MTPFDWNGLHVGDRVLVHDQSTESHFPLRTATVIAVDSKRPVHMVGIRVPDVGPAGDAVLWPTRAQIHLDPHDPSEACWRCETDARTTVEFVSARPAREAGPAPNANTHAVSARARAA
jgi:hypothetical protein